MPLDKNHFYDLGRPTPEQLEKMPAYQRNYILDLEHAVEELEGARESKGVTDLAFEHRVYGPRVYLPEQDNGLSAVIFKMTPETNPAPEFSRIEDVVEIRRGHTFYSPGGRLEGLGTTLTLRARQGRIEVLPKQRSEVVLRYVAE